MQLIYEDQTSQAEAEPFIFNISMKTVSIFQLVCHNKVSFQLIHSPLPQLHRAGETCAIEPEDGRGWVCWRGKSRGICLQENEGAELQPWTPTTAASPKHKPLAPLDRTNMDTQDLLDHCPHQSTHCQTNIHPKQVHSLSEANTTSRLGFKCKGPSQDMCGDEFHHGRRQTSCRRQHRWEHRPWGPAQRAEDRLHTQRHNSTKQKRSCHREVFKLGEMKRNSRKI